MIPSAKPAMMKKGGLKGLNTMAGGLKSKLLNGEPKEEI